MRLPRASRRARPFGAGGDDDGGAGFGAAGGRPGPHDPVHGRRAQHGEPSHHDPVHAPRAQHTEPSHHDPSWGGARRGRTATASWRRRPLRLAAVGPERRRRGDVVAAALIGAAVVIGALLVIRAGDERSTDDRVASPPLVAPAAGGVPTALVEAWRAPSPASPDPVVVGPAVVTAGDEPGGGAHVTGHDAVTGAAGWEYRRPEPVCTLGSGFGDVLAVFRTDGATGTWCSEVAGLKPATGERGPSRTADVRPGTRLLADSTGGAHVTATGRDYLEVWRNDLVATLQYGALPTPVQSSPQPRATCPHGSVAVGDRSVAVIERCAAEGSDRLSVLKADPRDADVPEDRLSVLTGLRGALVVATARDRTAFAAPDGTLRTVDGSGTPVASVPLGPVAGPTADPPGLGAGVRSAGPVLLWWTGRGTVGLDPVELTPRWTLPGTMGPGTALPTAGAGPVTALVPVPRGLAVVDAATGTVRATIPVDRSRDGGDTGRVGVAAVGTTVVEQRGPTLVALRPPR